ncbi:SDR family NAD(P)-dependent oxidoreductase [Paenibacillus sp. 1P07SE]|uniref:SDR family NAD(P)-dependent oxidoreductase n=1 Tax=Paenibacillus sp. 1P07SE TaxID=3132209 RepID=UPI0039A4B9DB
MAFEERLIMITGAARHTGYALADFFLARGATVVVNDRASDQVAQAVARLRAVHGERAVEGAADITDEAAVGRLFERLMGSYERLDVLINNACLQAVGFDFLTGRYADWKQVLDVNVNGMFLVSQHAANWMKAGGGGAIIHIGSTAATDAIRSRSPYVASKGAVDALTKAMALDLAGHGIRVNAVIPGYVRTTRWDAISDADVDSRRANIPLGAEAEYEDVAHAAAFLAGRQARNITGTRLVVDGGLTAQLVPESLEI